MRLRRKSKDVRRRFKGTRSGVFASDRDMGRLCEGRVDKRLHVGRVERWVVWIEACGVVVPTIERDNSVVRRQEV